MDHDTHTPNPEMSEQGGIQAKLWEQLMYASRLVMHGHRPMGGRPGVHMHKGQGRVLATLLGCDGASHKQLAQALGISPASVGELVVKLEQRGLVIRRFDQEDRRISSVYLTDIGAQCAQQAAQQGAQEIDGLLDGLTPQQQAQLYELLVALTDSLAQKMPHAHHGPHGGQGHGPHGPGREGCRGGGHRGPGMQGRGCRGHGAEAHRPHPGYPGHAGSPRDDEPRADEPHREGDVE